MSRQTLSSEIISSNSIAHVYGWGSTNPYDQSVLATHLQQLEVTIISNHECQQRFKCNKIQEFHMCAISPGGSLAPVSMSEKFSIIYQIYKE